MIDHRLIRVYVASMTKHAARWHDLREAFASQIQITSTWIDKSTFGDDASDLVDLWRSNIREVNVAHALIAYHEPGDQWKGAFVEIGAALARMIPVYLVGDPPGSWVMHPLVFRQRSIGDAAMAAIRYRTNRRYASSSAIVTDSSREGA